MCFIRSDYRSAAYEKMDVKDICSGPPQAVGTTDSFILREPFIIPTHSEYFRTSNSLSL